MPATTHSFCYAIVRSGASTTNPINIIYVCKSLDLAKSTIDQFVASSGFTSVPRSPPSDLRNLDGSVPDWFMGYNLWFGMNIAGWIYIERTRMLD
ncbi:hypothetical protein BU23DRAFT_555147 [Bimuria novae-zelandiae CBS 107.79]|uniref:Uncharacterized protein n=1 Tax=Bimuria novae-zelandiae CBS 107.79 TaxID=1447943 RepID=A0A6A5V657_9PLEO|nr:hypothetical protein BU23DRAFT_555147 [Bimuria novae-zelandiae CBS 107.79]